MNKMIDHAFESAFGTFKQHLENTFGARITDERALRKIFINELESLVGAALMMARSRSIT